ncbi:MAG: hypothetical protein ACXW06_03685 [Halobacteriota archaeon]
MRNDRRESNTSKEVCGQAVRPCEGGIVVDGEFGRPFQWKRSVWSSGLSGSA